MAPRSSLAALLIACLPLFLAGCGSPVSPTSPLLFTLSGTTTETAPTQSTAVGGVLIKVLSGASAGATATSDSQGRYSIPSLSGDVDLQLSREGYATRTVHVTVPTDQSATSLRIGPIPGIVTESDGNGGLFSGNSIVAPMHDDGEIVITDVAFYGFEEGDGMKFQILKDGQLVAETFLERSFPRNTVALRAVVEGGHMIEVRTASGRWTSIRFTHPR